MTETFKVAGVTKYEDNIRQLAVENDEYNSSNRELKECFDDGEQINEYEFDLDTLDVQLIPEPDNFYDPNAVRVEIDGLTVGYIKKGSCSHVKNLIASSDYFEVEVKSMGVGRYKKLYEDEDGNLQVERGRYPYCWVHLTVTAFPSSNRPATNAPAHNTQEATPAAEDTPTTTIAKPEPSKFVPFSSLEPEEKGTPSPQQPAKYAPRFDSTKLKNQPRAEQKKPGNASRIWGIILYVFGILRTATSVPIGLLLCAVAIGLLWNRAMKVNPDIGRKAPVSVIVLIVVALLFGLMFAVPR